MVFDISNCREKKAEIYQKVNLSWREKWLELLNYSYLDENSIKIEKIVIENILSIPILRYTIF